MTPEEIQAQWKQEFEAVRLRLTSAGGAAGVAEPATAARMSGLELMQAMLAGAVPYPHIADTLDFALIEVGPGTATFQGTPQLKHFNPMGGVHGGWYATVLDSALGCAVHTMMPAGRSYTTAELGINIVRAARLDTGPLRAMAKVLHCGRQLATAEARMVGPDGRLYAHATTTCLVFDLPMAKATG